MMFKNIFFALQTKKKKMENFDDWLDPIDENFDDRLDYSSENPHFSSSDDDDSEYNSEQVWCQYCRNKMPRFALIGHKMRKHKLCNQCGERMSASMFQEHINREHPQPIIDPNFPIENHTIVLRMTQLQIERFVRQLRIYVKNLQYFLKNDQMGASSLRQHVSQENPRPIDQENYPSENHTIGLRVTQCEFDNLVQQRRIYVKNGQNYLNDN